MTDRFVAEPILSGLTGFQRDTVAHVLDRFYGASPQRRFLIADETGLGKSMVARGVIAGAIERLQDLRDVDRIDIVYVCSNTDIADQNLRRLNVTGDDHLSLTSRLTLMALHAQRLRTPRRGSAKPVNLVAFTPGTSFAAGHSTGQARERALLHLMLCDILGLTGWEERASALLLQGGVGDLATFRRRISAVQASLHEGRPDPVVSAEFADLLTCHGLDTAHRAELAQVKGRRRLTDEERRRLGGHIGKLRAALAKAGVETLQPDLVILDEFQRFRELLDRDSGGPAAELAHHLFDHPDARVLLLSATPYKPFTYAEEGLVGDDHAKDFLATVRFLADGRSALGQALRADLRAFREAAVTGGDPTPSARRIRSRLLQVMSRVERPQLGRDGMLAEHAADADDLDPDDIVGYAALTALAREVGGQMSVEYWKSAPHFASFLDGYQLGERLRAALRDPAERRRLAPLVALAGGLDRAALERHRPVDLGSAKLRRLAADTVGRGWWKALWLPPSLPYLEPGPPYADLEDGTTKRLVFSSWAATPTAVAALLSHEASCPVAGGTHRGSDGQPVAYAPRLQYTVSQGRLTGMPTYALFAPNPGVALLADPLDAVRDGGGQPADVAAAEQRVAAALADAVGSDGASRSGASDAWYWSALLRLEGALPAALAHDPHAVAAALSGEVDDDQDARGALAHAERATELATAGDPEEAERPHDLRSTCARIGLHAPGNVAWRALARQVGAGSEVTAEGLWRAAAVIGDGFRSLFNRPETIALLELELDEPSYWRAVLRYCAAGNLQAVLDEYLHHLVASRGDVVLDDAALLDVAAEVRSAVALRPSTYQAFDPKRPDDPIRLPSRFALRYGSKRHSEDDARLPEVRRAFNSPFWPFVLATTSVGQEGIDLHWWCHAVVHWNIPANPVDFEQREGRVHRYGGHAIRRNIAAAHGPSALRSPGLDPWATAYRLAAQDRSDLGELAPRWVYPGPARIERHVAPYPLSSDQARLDRLKTDVALYRLTFGQPRQEDLLALLRRQGGRADGGSIGALHIDLRPPARQRTPAPRVDGDGPVRIADVVAALPGADVGPPTGAGGGRSAWEQRWPPSTLALVDRMEALIRSIDPEASLNYQAGHAGVRRRGKVTNYLVLRPRKASVLVRFRIVESAELTAALVAAGLRLTSYSRSWGTYGVRLTHDDLDRRSDILGDLVSRAMAWLDGAGSAPDA